VAHTDLSGVENWCNTGGLEKGHCTNVLEGKGIRKECKNYRGITLLSVPGKVFAMFY